MIVSIRGKVTALEPSHVCVECGGLGYLVRISLNTYSALQGKQEIFLHTHFQVREDAHTLFGFADQQELSLFEQLISISGVGGNTALMILSSISSADLYTAISEEDTQALKRVKGIGAKTAGRIILELKDKIKLPEGGSSATTAGGSQSQLKAEALAALVQLGLNKTVMSKRIDQILKSKGADLKVEEIIKLALKNG
ncbi:Holliday junction branch migration protein RuvA [Pontibacter sp. G13]|uniref:Holliday junction branch migration protein RuvA n=1 Tax=Pontibacter sp. G13 TaxID=3074898 RepID=UPI00288C5B18|nr:Holliday junction branch migration protein RuvA [Pontibacter sp. G13]WNJ21416.1 Holliday junction branch migration protein RuvA [Pontibacter sp. G13]